MDDYAALTESLLNNKKLNNYNLWIYENIKNALGKNIIEIGCGIGTIIKLMLKKDNKITGVDINDKYIKFLTKYYKNEKNLKFIKSDIINLPKKVKGKIFDTVVMVNVLEHIKDDDKALKIVNKLLKKNGKIALMVPAFNMLFGPLDKSVGHFRRYNKNQLKKLLIRNGFIIQDIYYMNFIGFFGWFLNVRLLRKDYTPQTQSYFFDKFFVPIIKRIEKFLKPPFGQSIIAIAIKK